MQNNKTKNIKIDDISRSFVRFKSGVSGSIEANWLATGCKMKHDFEIYGTKGAIRFSQERLNELQDNLLLCFTGFSRTAEKVAKAQIEATPAKEKESILLASSPLQVM